jgi:hypothetical protein
LVIQDILIRLAGALVIFSTGEQYLALGLRVADSDCTEALGRIASEADFGPFDRFLPFYQAPPADYDGKVPDVDRECHPSSDLKAAVLAGGSFAAGVGGGVQPAGRVPLACYRLTTSHMNTELSATSSSGA